jgi:hypothetical protein
MHFFKKQNIIFGIIISISLIICSFSFNFSVLFAGDEDPSNFKTRLIYFVNIENYLSQPSSTKYTYNKTYSISGY